MPRHAGCNAGYHALLLLLLGLSTASICAAGEDSSSRSSGNHLICCQCHRR
jgi:hypothetical protein